MASSPSSTPSNNTNPQVRDVDLSQYTSDGTGHEPPLSPPWQKATDQEFVADLTREFDCDKHVARLGYHINCINAPPQGYALHYSKKPITPSLANQDLCYIYGHPNGHFRSLEKFAEHIVSIVQGNVGGCVCQLCTGPPAPGPPPPRVLPSGAAESSLF